MARISVSQGSVPGTDSDPERRHADEVLGVPSGASRRGSTYWKGVRLCPREAGLVQLGLKREGFLRGRVALDTGLIYHHALEKYYEALMAHQERMDGSATVCEPAAYCSNPEAERAAWESLKAVAAEPGYENIFGNVERMLSGYFEFYRMRDRFRILDVEATFEYHCADQNFDYSARLDTLVEDLENGGSWVLEHKSATTLTDDLLGGYQMDLQTLGQYWLMQQFIERENPPIPPLRGVIVNLASKKKVPEFRRVEVCPSPDHVRMFEVAVGDQSETLHLWESLGWPKHLGNCTGGGRYFSTCQFFTVCQSFPMASVEEIADNPPFGFTSHKANQP